MLMNIVHNCLILKLGSLKPFGSNIFYNKPFYKIATKFLTFEMYKEEYILEVNANEFQLNQILMNLVIFGLILATVNLCS